MKDKRPTSFAPTDPASVQQIIDELNAALKDKLSYTGRNWPANIAKYNEQERILAGRGSYNKIDPSVTFMRMKEDHMKNGQLKPGYNLQLSREKQFIVNYTLHSNPTDTLTLPAHIEDQEQQTDTTPKTLTADEAMASGRIMKY